MGQSVAPVAAWKTKRDWVSYAFSELENAGYTVRSAYTAVKNPAKTRFVYTDLLWSGADMVGLGVASFSHVQGVHFQNEHEFETYSDKLRHGVLPIYRALTLTQEQRMIRELILQMKLGHVRDQYFKDKFGIRIQERFAGPVSICLLYTSSAGSRRGFQRGAEFVSLRWLSRRRRAKRAALPRCV